MSANDIIMVYGIIGVFTSVVTGCVMRNERTRVVVFVMFNSWVFWPVIWLAAVVFSIGTTIHLLIEEI